MQQKVCLSLSFIFVIGDVILHRRNCLWYLARAHDQFHTAVELKEKEPRLIVFLSIYAQVAMRTHAHARTLFYYSRNI